MKLNRVHLIPLVFLVVFALGRLTCQEIPLDRVGVKSNVVGQGTVRKDYTPGYCFIIPGLQRLYLMDPTIQDYTMADEVAVHTERTILGYSAGQVLTYRTGEPIRNLRTKDEFTVTVDITVLYRIKPGEAHKVRIEVGPDYRFQEILEGQARKIIWDVLAQLSTPDFYNSKLRTAQTEQARRDLNRAVGPYHLEVLQVLVRNITFQEEYEKRLQAKQLIELQKRLADDTKLLEEAREKTQMVERGTTAAVIAIEAELDKERKQLVGETEVKIAKVAADASLEAKKLTAGADSYKRQQIALGDLARTSATAVGDKAMAEAYQGQGGELFLARQLLTNLEIGDVEINTNQTNPFDVKQILEMIGLNLAQYVKAP
jgi:hypothetical protein